MHSILSKTTAREYDCYSNYVLKKHSGINLKVNRVEMSKSFWEKSSLFNVCWKWLNLEKINEADCIIIAARVNRECERFELDELTPDMFRCLIFAKGHAAGKDIAVATEIFAELKQNQVVTLQRMSEGREIIINLRYDTKEYWT